MKAHIVAAKEFRDASRSRMLWAVIALFALFSVGGAVAFDRLYDGLTAVDATRMLAVPASKIVPLAALLVGYLAVAGERDSGSIRVLLGLPATRADVVVGKLVGRTGVVAVAVLVAFGAGGLAVFALFGTFPLADLVALAVLTALFGLAYVGIAVGVSSFAATRARAMAGAIGVYALFGVLWGVVPAAIHYLIEGAVPEPPLPAWYLLVIRINPEQAYAAAGQFLLGEFGTSYVVDAGGNVQQGAARSLSELVAGSVPFYLEPWFGLVVLGAWLLVPVGIGYLRFRTADLG